MKLENARQKLAYENIQNAADQRIGELENCLSDYPPEYEAYQSAERELNDHDQLVKDIYEMAISGYYQPGCAYVGASGQKMSRQVRFCGKEWLMKATEEIVTKEGY